MEEHNSVRLSYLGDYASVETCAGCVNGLIQINYFNVTLRFCRNQFRAYVKMINEAMKHLGMMNSGFREFKVAYPEKKDEESFPDKFSLN